MSEGTRFTALQLDASHSSEVGPLVAHEAAEVIDVPARNASGQQPTWNQTSGAPTHANRIASVSLERRDRYLDGVSLRKTATCSLAAGSQAPSVTI
jgi:hypothetical protein